MTVAASWRDLAAVSRAWTCERMPPPIDRRAGESLGVVDSEQSYQDWTFSANLTWAVTRVVSVHGLVGRGFRAPNLNDLGALGLNDLGYEVPAASTIDVRRLHRSERR